MPKRFLTMSISAVLAAAVASVALAQPKEDPQASVRSSREGEPRERGPMGDRGRMIDIDKTTEAVVAWLREHDLGAFADKVAELPKSDNPMKRVILWRVHGRIEGWKRLQGDDQRRALEEARLEFDIPKLAAAARAAPAGAAGAAAREALRKAVERQADLRIELSKAFCDMIEKRLDEFREQLDKQTKLRQDLIAQRLTSLTDPATPLPDPLKDLIMESADFGRGERPESDGPPAPPPPGEGDGKKPEPAPPPTQTTPVRGGRMAEQFDKQIDSDIAWLREKALTAFADRVEALHKENNRFLLWQIHRRVRQIMSLRPEDQAQAIEGEKLRFAVLDLARQWREAAAGDRPAIAEKLKDALNRQFDLRQKAQEAIMAAIKKRLDEALENVATLRKHRDEVVQRRYEELLDPTKAIPEPSLVPEPRGDRRGPPRDRDGGGRRPPEDGSKTPRE